MGGGGEPAGGPLAASGQSLFGLLSCRFWNVKGRDRISKDPPFSLRHHPRSPSSATTPASSRRARLRSGARPGKPSHRQERRTGKYALPALAGPARRRAKRSEGPAPETKAQPEDEEGDSLRQRHRVDRPPSSPRGTLTGCSCFAPLKKWRISMSRSVSSWIDGIVLAQGPVAGIKNGTESNFKSKGGGRRISNG